MDDRVIDHPDRAHRTIAPSHHRTIEPWNPGTGARFLDRGLEAFDSDKEGRAGVDAKVVVRDAVTFDFTVNPDFSQVESDEPQVTVNQRFEVFFPERRPFFLENANYFETPINLFFSRRIRDPQFSARATGKIGGWVIGALASDDRGPGHLVDATDPLFGYRSGNAVFRARREFGQSSVGALLTARDFGPSSNRIASIDSRIRLNKAWFFGGQAATSDSTAVSGTKLQGSTYSVAVNKGGRKLTYSLPYSD
ncbi:MAG: DUF5916 domain-containing protein, partial [Vicinamibacterales bacterium]